MIRNMNEMGMSNSDMAKELGISRITVSKMLKRTRLQEKKKRNRGSKLDPYKEKIRSLKEEHNISGVSLLKEIRKRGYNVGYTILKEYCHDIRKDRRLQAVYI